MHDALDTADLPEALAQCAAQQWSRLQAAGAGEDLSDIPAARRQALAPVLATSEFVAEFAIREPGRFWELVRGNGLAARPAANTAATIAALTAAQDEESALRSVLRRFRNEAMVRIIWRDLTGEAPLAETVAALTALADASLRAATDWLGQALESRFGRPRGRDGSAQRLLIVTMGKLGGEELNLSSDIDLILVYPGRGDTDGPSSVDNQVYFERLCKRLIGVIADVTEDGFVFRVDTRLRPFGDSGPLCVSFAALEHYYATHGRDWERYAMIKARTVTGDNRSKQALTDLYTPFVYRKYLDFGALSSIREMKALIEAEVRRGESEDDLKLGPGGIREIEFIVQTFQLIRGGREPALREHRFLPALAALGDLGILDPETVAVLRDAYVFLRNAEHRLQAIRDQQTQRLPGDALDRARLAYAMGFADWSDFAAALAAHRAAVRERFDALLHVPRPDADRKAPDDHWFDPSDRDALSQALAARGFEAASEAADIVLDLWHSHLRSRLSRDGAARLDALLPRLLEEIGQRQGNPVLLSRTVALIRAIAARSVYLALLTEHPQAVTRLLDLFAASSWIADQIVRQPFLLDELLDPRRLFVPLSKAELRAELDRQMHRHAQSNTEQNMETLRAFRQQQVLRVAASDIMKQFPIAEVSNQLSYIAETCVAFALDSVRQDLVAEYGEPAFTLDGRQCTAGFAVIAFGKLGGLELSYSSDLDLVFLHDSRGSNQATRGPKQVDNETCFTRMARRLIHYLNTPTPGGIVYEVDLRLRPSGASGLMVSSLEAFAEYESKAAWTWEHQALVRARFIAGDPMVGERFNEIREAVLRRRRDPVTLASDIRDMRMRMLKALTPPGPGNFDLKADAGGITDIEFMVQYGVLRWAHDQAGLVEYTDNLRILERLAELDLMPAGDCRSLHDAYFSFREEVHRLALLDMPTVVPEQRFAAERSAVQKLWRNLIESEIER